MGKITNQELDTTLVTQLSNSDSHIANTSNPHGVTASQVGAEPANANIQTHISSTSNPHGVTASQVGAEPANANIQTHISSTSNPHNVTASQVGAEPAITAGTTGQYWRGDKTWQTLPSPDLSAYATKESPTFTGTVVLPSTTSIGTVSNTEISYLDGVTSAVQTQLNSKAPTASPTFTGTVTIPAGASFSVTGQAPAYSCRAWVNFKGTGTVAIRSSGNVSSITDNGTGHYTVNLATAMQDVNYSAVGMAGGDTDNLINVSHNEVTYPQTTTACRFTTTYQNATPYDAEVVSIGIFR